MGADISLVVEYQITPGGPWQLATRPGSASLDWYDVRAYECFSLLTGLDFSARELRPLTPVAPLRGWPEDLSGEARARLTSWSDSSAFGQSWLNASDFAAYKWNTPMTWTFMAAPPVGRKVNDKMRTDAQRHIDRYHQLPTGWAVAGWSRDGFDAALPTTPKDHLGEFLGVIRDMTNLANGRPTSVRCVFEFTR